MKICPQCEKDLKLFCRSGKCDTICSNCGNDFTKNPPIEKSFNKIIEEEKHIRNGSEKDTCPVCGSDQFKRMPYGKNTRKCLECEFEKEEE